MTIRRHPKELFKNVIFMSGIAWVGTSLLFSQASYADRRKAAGCKSTDDLDTVEIIRCESSSDCALVRKHCGAMGANDKKYSDEIQKRFNEESVYITCNKSEFVSADRIPRKYVAECVNGTCKAKEASAVENAAEAGKKNNLAENKQKTRLTKPKRVEEATLGEVSCKVHDDCVLVMHPCEGKEAYNKEFKQIAEMRIVRNARAASCPYVDSYIYFKKMRSKYEAKCVNNICHAEVVQSAR